MPKLSQIFKNIPVIGPSKDLLGLIFERIEREKYKQMRTRLIVSYFGIAGSFSILILAIVLFGTSIVRSEFWKILSLVFSDALVVAKYWNEYAYSLLETLPIANILMVLIPAFALFMFFSLLLSTKNVRYGRNHFAKLHS